MFNLQNSQCVETLHLLLTDISDKFSDSSSSFLSINARIGGRHLEGFIGACLCCYMSLPGCLKQLVLGLRMTVCVVVP
jgi:hypothetical protein